MSYQRYETNARLGLRAHGPRGQSTCDDCGGDLPPFARRCGFCSLPVMTAAEVYRERQQLIKLGGAK